MDLTFFKYTLSRINRGRKKWAYRINQSGIRINCVQHLANHAKKMTLNIVRAMVVFNVRTLVFHLYLCVYKKVLKGQCN
jgi:hypothetical protein